MRATFVLALSLFAPTTAMSHDFEARDSGSTEVTRSYARALAVETLESRAYGQLYSYIADGQLWTGAAVRLSVCFWDPEKTTLIAKVVEHGDKVAAGLPVTFVWKQGGSYQTCTQDNASTFDVRVSLVGDSKRLAPIDNPNTFFAVIGRDGRRDTRLATVNLPFKVFDSEEKIANRVTHEFCHVLGCLHEHQRGDCADAFDEAKIRAKYGLSQEVYRQQYLRVAERMSPVARGAFDPKSVMMYEFTPDLFRTPTPPSNCVREKEPVALSGLDTDGLKAAYTGRSNRMTLAAFLSRADELDAQAAARRQRLFELQTNMPSLSGWNRVNPLARYRQDRMSRRAERLQAQVSDLSATADTYRLKPETIEALKAAEALAQRLRGDTD